MSYLDSEFHSIMGKVGPRALVRILEKSEMKYGYNKNTKIYSAKFYVKKAKGIKKERILSMLVSPKFLEYTLSDSKGNVLELIRQEGKKLNFSNFKKKKKR